MDLLPRIKWIRILYVRFVLPLEKERRNIAILSAICIFDFLRKEVRLYIVLSLLFVDAIESLSTVGSLQSFGLLMLLIYHFVIGSHFHDLVTQNVLILDAQLYRARILFRNLPMLVGRIDVRFALHLFQSYGLCFLPIDHLERAQSRWRRIADTHGGAPSVRRLGENTVLRLF